jgi:hypothetical protein
MKPDLLKRRADEIVDRINGTQEQLAKAVRTARERLDRIDADDRLTPEAKSEERRAVKAKLRERADVLAQANADARVELDEIVEKATAVDNSDPATALLVGQRRDQAWRRAVALIDAGHDPLEIAHRAALAGDRDTVDALRAELPTHLEVRGEPADLREQTLAGLEATAADTATPIEQAAAEARAAASGADEMASLAIGFVRSDGATADALPTADGSMVELGSYGQVPRGFAGGGDAA